MTKDTHTDNEEQRRDAYKKLGDELGNSFPLETRIGMLRQWLNEDRIKDAERFVTNEQIRHWLDLKPTPTAQAAVRSDEFPAIKGSSCPACKRSSLFLATGSYITCGNLECPNPDYEKALSELHSGNSADQDFSRTSVESAPTKSSGELEDYAARMDALIGILGAQSPKNVWSSMTDNQKIKLERLLAKHTTQTTKLQAEARIEGALDAVAAIRSVGYSDAMWYQPNQKEVLALFPEYKVSTADIPSGKRKFLDFMVKALNDQLEREHKIGEDGENT